MRTPKGEPLALTRFLLEEGTFDEWIKEAWKLGITADQVFAMTPARVAATFYRAAPTGSPDPLLALVASNAARGRAGLPPLSPPWFRDLLTERTRARADD